MPLRLYLYTAGGERQVLGSGDQRPRRGDVPRHGQRVHQATQGLDNGNLN